MCVIRVRLEKLQEEKLNKMKDEALGTVSFIPILSHILYIYLLLYPIYVYI
jgi:hypothetical protein